MAQRLMIARLPKQWIILAASHWLNVINTFGWLIACNAPWMISKEPHRILAPAPIVSSLATAAAVSVMRLTGILGPYALLFGMLITSS